MSLAKKIDWTYIFRGGSGYCHGVWDKVDGGAMFNFLTFISWQNRDELEIEVTYFPDDIELETFTLEKFRSMVVGWRSLLGSKSYYVRCENVSWEYHNEKDPGIEIACPTITFNAQSITLPIFYPQIPEKIQIYESAK